MEIITKTWDDKLNRLIGRRKWDSFNVNPYKKLKGDLRIVLFTGFKDNSEDGHEIFQGHLLKLVKKNSEKVYPWHLVVWEQRNGRWGLKDPKGTIQSLARALRAKNSKWIVVGHKKA